MKKTLFLLFVLIVLMALPSGASYQRHYWFLGGAVDITAGATRTHPATLTSRSINVEKYSICSLTVVFSRAAGAADTVNVELWCSPDGSTWSLLRELEAQDEPLLQIPTNTDAITGTTVRVTFLVNIQGIRYLRLGSIENSDGVNNITGVNVLCSLGSI